MSERVKQKDALTVTLTYFSVRLKGPSRKPFYKAIDSAPLGLSIGIAALIFYTFNAENHQMQQHLSGKEQYDVQYRHNEGRYSLGNGIKGIAHNEKPIKEVRIPF